jgi:hypothetical protein
MTATQAKPGGAPTRTYVVLERQIFEQDESAYFVEVHKVEARNGTNALRRAYRELERTEATTLIAIPESMWRLTPVRGRVRESVAVEIGTAE